MLAGISDFGQAVACPFVVSGMWDFRVAFIRHTFRTPAFGLVRESLRLIREALPHDHEEFDPALPVLNVLIAGDSGPYVGASKSRGLTGRLASRLQSSNPRIKTAVKAGRTIAETAEALAHVTDHFDVVILMVGTNDAFRHWKALPLDRNYTRILSSARILLREAKRVAEHVLVIYPPDLGCSPFFGSNEFLKERMTFRSWFVRQALREARKEFGVARVDLFRISQVPQLRENWGKKFAATDMFHLGDDGFDLIARLVCNELARKRIVPLHRE